MIPDFLPPRFLNWRMIDGAKVPCNAQGLVVDAHDVRNHTDHATALASPYNVAFAMRDEDGLFFLDLDKCRAEDGAWSSEATAIFTSFNGCWGEISSSGTGLHIIGRADPARLKAHRNKWDGWLECYTGGRFIAFGSTGWQPIGGTSRPDIDWTDQLCRIVPERPFLGDLPEGVDERYTLGNISDDDLIGMMLKSTGGAGAAFGMKATVKQLWEADPVVLPRIYPDMHGGTGFDHSSADAALMSHLAFWTGKDMPRMDRLFRRSGLMREKYEKRDDYRRDTVQGAARLCRQVYDKPRAVAGAAPVPVAAGGVYLTIEEMKEHFAGCVYIRDLHRILVPDGALLKTEQFNATYGGYSFQMMPDGTKPTTKAFEALTENRTHRFPHAVRPTFRPDLPGGIILNDGSVNTYVPPEVDMTPGDVSKYLTLVEKLIPNERDRTILMSWMARVVQSPGVKLQWSPVLQGCEGNGKTAIFSCVSYAVGKQYTHQPQAAQLAEKYNSYIEGKVFILVEEVHMQGKREMLDVLKPLVTNKDIEVRGMAQDKRMIVNLANWGFCTNYRDAVLKSRNDRRYAIFYTAHQSKEDIDRDGLGGGFFPDFYDWLNNRGGYAAVAHYLSTYKIAAEFDPAGLCHRAPETSSTAEAVDLSLGGLEHDICEAAQDNTQGFRNGWISSWALDRLVRDRGYRISRNKQVDILRDMGYEAHGRSPSPILQEDGKRPMLYVSAAADVSQGYARAQNYPGI